MKQINLPPRLYLTPVVANFSAPDLRAYILAAGMLAGYGGFGASELFFSD